MRHPLQQSSKGRNCNARHAKCLQKSINARVGINAMYPVTASTFHLPRYDEPDITACDAWRLISAASLYRV